MSTQQCLRSCGSSRFTKRLEVSFPNPGKTSQISLVFRFLTANVHHFGGLLLYNKYIAYWPGGEWEVSIGMTGRRNRGAHTSTNTVVEVELFQ